MERWTSALEFLGIVLIIVAIGWQIALLLSIPVALLAAGLLAFLASWILQGARLPRRKGGRR